MTTTHSSHVAPAASHRRRLAIRRRPPLPFLFLLATLLSPTAVHAGEYVLTLQTGGTYQYVPFNGPPSVSNYSMGYYGYGAGGPADAQSLSGTGPITSVFEWQSSGPGDDPPEKVVVWESCTASTFAFANPAPMCVADNGLGDAAATSGPSPVYDSYGEIMWYQMSSTSSGTRYQILQGQQTITVVCEPEATANGPGYVYASVGYWVGVDPVEVNLSGGIGIGNAKRYLIGQKVTATLSSGPLTPTSYS